MKYLVNIQINEKNYNCTLFIKCGSLFLTDSDLHLLGLKPDSNINIIISFKDPHLFQFLSESNSLWWQYFDDNNISYQVKLLDFIRSEKI